jgi:hypothetical protein
MEMEIRACSGQGKPRGAATGTHIDNRASAQVRQGGHGIVEMKPSRCVSVADGCHSGGV